MQDNTGEEEREEEAGGGGQLHGKRGEPGMRRLNPDWIIQRSALSFTNTFSSVSSSQKGF